MCLIFFSLSPACMVVEEHPFAVIWFLLISVFRYIRISEIKSLKQNPIILVTCCMQHTLGNILFFLVDVKNMSWK